MIKSVLSHFTLLCLAVAFGVGGSPAHAAGISLSPSFQEITAVSSSTESPLVKGEKPSDSVAKRVTSASITFSNNTTTAANLEFSLAKIMATDVLGRFQFNAPLPQTIQSATESATIEPKQVTLEPGAITTVTATFNTTLLRPGTNSFLLLGKMIATPTTPPPSQGGGGGEVLDTPSQTSLSQYLAATILVESTGGSNILLKLIESDLSSGLRRIPIRFSLPDFITLTIKNEGNARGIPRGLGLVKDQSGKELMRGPINEKSTILLPGSQRVIYVDLASINRSWPIAWCHIQLVGYDEQHQSSFKQSQSFLYVNPWMSLVIPFIAAAIFFSRKKRLY